MNGVGVGSVVFLIMWGGVKWSDNKKNEKMLSKKKIF